MRIKYAMLLLLMLPAAPATAQKLPAVQKKGIRAPDNVKVDGRLTEWGDKLQAYNNTTQVFYTIANDDEYLYLIVRATDKNAIQKIDMGGITLSVSSSEKKLKDAPAITFPVYDKMGSKYFSVDDRPVITKNAERDRMQTDSFVNVKRKQLIEYFKWIGIANIKGISDNVLSIYNEEGIKVAFLLDAGVGFNCEMAIPLKYLEIGDKGRFYYNINLNGEARYSTGIMEVRTGMYTYVKADGKSYSLGGSTTGQAYMLFPTDFSAEYTLIKK